MPSVIVVFHDPWFLVVSYGVRESWLTRAKGQTLLGCAIVFIIVFDRCWWLVSQVGQQPMGLPGRRHLPLTMPGG